MGFIKRGRLIYLIVCICFIANTSLMGENMMGAKIYDYDKPLPPLFKQWKDLGFNTMLISDVMAAKPEFMKLAKENNIKTFIIAPMFCSPDKPVADSLYARNAKNEKALSQWVHFVCPLRQSYRRRRLEFVKQLIRKYKPDGISIDFIRYFAYWEKIPPQTVLDPLDNTCFCDTCLQQMQKDLKFTFPGRLKTRTQKAQWVFKHKEAQWTAWKCKIITTMVKEVALSARSIDPEILLNAHIVPWRSKDFAAGIRKRVGQDIIAISAIVDYVSPMCYSHMVKQSPQWVHDVVKDMAAQSSKPVIPSIQVKKAYLKEPFTLESFKQALKAALKKPSGGILFWNWKALAENNEKQKIVKVR